jgi:hypothetical protein
VSARAALLCASLALLPAVALGEIVAQRREDGTLVMKSVGSPPRSGGPLRPIAPPPSLQPKIERYAGEHGLDPRLVQALIQVESGYDERALSHKGAIGLMQLMPSTATELGVANPWDAVQNLRGGTRYLRKLLDRFAGNLELALAGYNAGATAVERHRGVPPYLETQDYVKKVLSLYRGAPAPSPPSPLAPPLAALRDESVASQGPAAAPAASAASPVAPRGRPVVARRDASGQLVLTTPSRH